MATQRFPTLGFFKKEIKAEYTAVTPAPQFCVYWNAGGKQAMEVLIQFLEQSGQHPKALRILKAAYFFLNLLCGSGRAPKKKRSR